MTDAVHTVNKMSQTMQTFAEEHPRLLKKNLTACSYAVKVGNQPYPQKGPMYFAWKNVHNCSSENLPLEACRIKCMQSNVLLPQVRQLPQLFFTGDELNTLI